MRQTHYSLFIIHPLNETSFWWIFPVLLLSSDQFLFLYSVTGNNHQNDCMDWKKNTNHSHKALLVNSQLGCSSDLFLLIWLLVGLCSLPYSGLLWAVFLSCLTREMGGVQESGSVLRTSHLPALTLSSCWRSMAMEKWESTVSETERKTYSSGPQIVPRWNSGSTT